jgi:hypothetical protein
MEPLKTGTAITRLHPPISKIDDQEDPSQAAFKI